MKSRRIEVEVYISDVVSREGRKRAAAEEVSADWPSARAMPKLKLSRKASRLYLKLHHARVYAPA
jgi:hypothetical protein